MNATLLLSFICTYGDSNDGLADLVPVMTTAFHFYNNVEKIAVIDSMIELLQDIKGGLDDNKNVPA